MKKLFSLLGIAILALILYTNTIQARVDGTEGKACPDINNDNCCEKGNGNCAETLEIHYNLLAIE